MLLTAAFGAWWAVSADPFIGIAAIIAAAGSAAGTVIAALNRRTAKIIEYETREQTHKLDDQAEKIDAQTERHTEVAETAAEANRALRDWLVDEAARRRTEGR